MTNQTLVFKLRIWLVRRLSGKYSLDKLTEQQTKHTLQIAVSTMYDNLQKYIDDTMQASITKLPQNMLASVIAANEYLTELQKAQIASIINTPSQRDNSNYFG